MINRNRIDLNKKYGFSIEFYELCVDCGMQMNLVNSRFVLCATFNANCILWI